MYRHGDVLILPVAEIPAGAEPEKREKGDIILAHGEVTGHAHRIKEKKAQTFVLDDKRYLYEVRIQRAYTPEAIVRVVD